MHANARSTVVLVIWFMFSLCTPTFAGEFLTANTQKIGAVGARVLADFNADGVPDLAIVDSGRSQLLVFLGIRHGGFATPSVYPLGVGPIAIVRGDFNGDGKTDLIVANHGNPSISLFGTLSVLLGNGDGTFQQPATESVGSIFLKNMTAGDVNNDGRLDLVITNTTASNQTQTNVLLGKGNGTFQNPAGAYPASVFVGSLVLADFNNDGKQDLAEATTLYCQGGNCSLSAMTVFLGNGDGTFGTGVNYVSGATAATSVAVGDLNGDGNLDMVVTSTGVSHAGNGNGAPGILLGNNPSTANQPVTLTATMSASVRGSGTPTGTVMFKEGTTILGTAALNNGKANLTVSFKAGTHKIKPIYSGDTNFNTFTGQAFTQTVNP